jgi:hypothetical protein
MQHLEEGTIHAWLDEALSSEESARVEAHVQECSECAAMVADARGLIAGASRIVSALDIVPGGVLPKPAPVAPAPGKSLWRSLHLTPFRAALAASLMIAAASVFTARSSRRPDVLESPERPQSKVVAPMAQAPAAAASPTTTMGNSAIAAANADRGPSAKRELHDSIAVMRVSKEAPAVKPLAAPVARTVSQPLNAVAAADTTSRFDSTRVAADARAAAPVPTPPPAGMIRADSARARRISEVVTTSGGGAGGGRGQQAQARMSMEVPRRALASENSFASGYEVAGCYRVSDSTSWPRTLPTQFFLAGDSTAVGARRYVRLVRDARVDTSVVGTWQPTGLGTVLVSFNGTTPASRFLLTQGPAGSVLTPVPQDAARQESAARTRGTPTVRMSCR